MWRSVAFLFGCFFGLWWWVVACMQRCLMHPFSWREGDYHLPPSMSLSWSSFLGHGRATESRWAWPIRSVVAPLTPFLPNAVKNGPGRGWGTTMHGNRTVTQIFAPNSCSPKEEMLPVFFILFFRCLVRCLLPFFCRSSFFRVAFWKNFRERTFVIRWLCWFCVFWWVFAIVFALFFGVSLPKLFGKILLMSGLVFSGFVLSSLGFSPTSFLFLFFLFERHRSGSHRTPLHTHLCCWFLFFLCPAAFVCFARFGRASRFSAFFSGCHSGPRAFL